LKAAVYRGPGKLKLEDIANPIIEKDDEILIRVKISIICGTDIKTYLRGHPQIKPPTVLGHEFAGEVIEIGNKVNICKIGDKVAIAPFVNCGECFFCQKGLFELCKNRSFPSNGSFTEYVKISQSFGLKGLVKFPENIDLEEAALTEPLACVVNSIENCDIGLGDKVLIVGAGPMGLLNLLIVQLKGASQIIISETMEERREIASKLGALTVNPLKNNLSSFVHQYTEGRGADEVIVAVGNSKIAEAVIGLARPGGRVILFGGFPGSSSLTFDPNLVHYDQISIIGGSGFSPQQFKQAAELIKHCKINLKQIITHRFTLNEIGKAFDLSIAQKGLKIAIISD